MEKIRQFFKKYVGTDGLLHIVVCFAIVTATGHFVNSGLACFCGIFAGFFKEIIWDAWMRKGTFELKDLVCDVFGAMCGFAAVMLGTLV